MPAHTALTLTCADVWMLHGRQDFADSATGAAKAEEEGVDEEDMLARYGCACAGLRGRGCFQQAPHACCVQV